MRLKSRLMMMNKNLKHHIFFFIGIIIILSTIWSRLFREYLPKAIGDFNNTYMLCLIYINITFLVIQMLTACWMLFNTTKTPTTGRLLGWLLSHKVFLRLTEIIAQGPKTVWEFIYDRINIALILEKPFYNSSHYIKNLPVRYAYILTIIHITFCVIPRVVPAILFVLELLLSGHLNYFYKSLILYLVRLAYKSLLWILADLSDKNIYFATAHVTFDYIRRDDYIATFQKEVPPIEGAVDIIAKKFDQKLLDWFCYIYNTYLDIKWLCYRLNLEQQKLKHYESLVTSLLYLIGWFFIILHLLKCI